MFVLMQQAGLSLGLAGSSFALEAAGYLTPSAGQAITQPPAVLTTLRVLVSLAPAVILLCSIPLALRYPLTRERFTEIQRQARERQGN